METYQIASKKLEKEKEKLDIIEYNNYIMAILNRLI